RPIDSSQRSSQRSARCTYSGHSTRLISAQGSRHIDRRAVLIAVIALDHDRRAVLIAVIAPDLDSRTKSSSKSPIFQVKYLKKENTYEQTERFYYKLQLYYFFNTITSPAFNSSLILTKPLLRNSSSSSLSRDPYLDYLLLFLLL
ncbi:hypothetical protein L249_7979, partial [Ophiocordyceps polyrhachis-furcata BCC 54312]